METRFETFTVLIARIGRSIRRIKAEEMARFRLKGPHVSCLYYLSLAGPMTASELRERCEEDKAALSRSLNYLEREGYICCAGGGARGYRTPLALTDRGREVCEAITGAIDRIVAAAGDGLSQADRQTMYRALSCICARLEAISEPSAHQSQTQ